MYTDKTYAKSIDKGLGLIYVVFTCGRRYCSPTPTEPLTLTRRSLLLFSAQDSAGNKCDASGFYPGEGRYKDPIRPDVSFAE